MEWSCLLYKFTSIWIHFPPSVLCEWTCSFCWGTMIGAFSRTPSTIEVSWVQLICVHSSWNHLKTVAMLFWMVMFTSLVHHIHQFGCISFHLLFLMSECGLSVVNYDTWNSWMFEASGCSSQPHMLAGFLLWWVQLVCVHFILAFSWTITLFGKVMFGWRVQCVHQPLHSPPAILREWIGGLW